MRSCLKLIKVIRKQKYCILLSTLVNLYTGYNFTYAKHKSYAFLYKYFIYSETADSVRKVEAVDYTMRTYLKTEVLN